MRNLGLLLTLTGLSTSLHAATIHPTDKLFLQDLGVGVQATAINDNGQVVGQDASGKAFRWENGVFTPLGTLGGTQSFANDINNSGTVVGWSLNSEGKKKAFKWGDTLGTMENLDKTIPYEGAAEAINNVGEIVGWRTNGTNYYRSEFWNRFSNEGNDLFQDFNHIALGINDDANVVGVTLSDDGSELRDGYFWKFGSPGSFSHYLDAHYFPYAGINNQNMTAGEASKGAGYMNSSDLILSGFRRLLVTDTFSSAYGLNDNNIIVGESSSKGFIFDITTRSLYDINDFDFSTHQFEYVMRLTDINNNGDFVGTAWANGQTHGVVGNLYAVPEPSTLSLLTLGLSDLIVWVFSDKKETKDKDELTE